MATQPDTEKAAKDPEYAKYLDKGESVKASGSSLLYSVLATDQHLIAIRKFPPKTKKIPYGKLSSVEHRRLTDWGALAGFMVFVTLFVLIPGQYLSPPLTEFIGILDGQLGNILPPVADILFGLSLLCFVIAIYYVAKFIISFFTRLVVYQEGMKPMALTMPSGEATKKLISILDQKIEKVSTPVTEEQIKKIVSDELDSLINDRQRMVRQVKSRVKQTAQKVETAEDKEKIKQIIEEGIKRIEEKDEEIAKRFEKRGVKRDDVFKKYHLKPPKEEFVQSVLKEANLSDLKL